MTKVMKSFICKGCFNPVTSTVLTCVDIGAIANLDIADKFCYLGDKMPYHGNCCMQMTWL